MLERGQSDVSVPPPQTLHSEIVSERARSDVSVPPPQALHSEIVSERGRFAELERIGGQLSALVGDEEAAALTARLRDVTGQYGRLVEDSETLGRLLRQAGTQLRSLVLNYEDFLAWMDETQQRLDKYRVLSVHVDKLHEQMEELTVSPRAEICT